LAGFDAGAARRRGHWLRARWWRNARPERRTDQERKRDVAEKAKQKPDNHRYPDDLNGYHWDNEHDNEKRASRSAQRFCCFA